MTRILILLLIFFSSNLFATESIITWGYGELVKNVLEAISSLVSNDGLNTIFKITLGISFLLFAFKKSADDRVNLGFEFAKMMTFAAAVWYLFLTAPNDDKHRFLIEDRVTGDNYVVEQIPTGIGMPYALISQVEDKIIEKMEIFFSMPNSISYREAGFGFPLKLHYTMKQLTMLDPYLVQTFNNFIKDCTINEVDSGEKDFQDILYSDDTLTELDPDGDTRLTKDCIDDHSCPQKTCKDTYDDIKDTIQTDELDKQLTLLAALNSVEGSSSSRFEEQVSDTWSFLFNDASKGSRDYIQQRMIINATKKSFLNAAKATGLSPSELAYASAFTDKSKENFFLQGHLAKDYLPIIKGVLTTLIVGLSWIIALLSVMFNNFAYIKMYFTLLLWIMMWSPVLVVINYIGDIYVSHIFEQITNSTGQTLSLYTNSFISDKVSSALSWLGYLVWLVPLLAYSIVKGSEQGFVMLANSISGVAGAGASAGTSAGNSLGTTAKPTIRVGNEIITDNAGMNQKYNTNHDFNHTNEISQMGKTSKVTTDFGGVDTTANNGHIVSASVKGATASVSSAINSTYSEQSNQLKAKLNASTDSYANSVSAGVTKALNQNSAVTIADTHNTTASERKETSEAISEAAKKTFSHDTTAQKKFDEIQQYIASGGGALSLKIVKGGVEYRMTTSDGKTLSYTDKSAEAFDRAKQFTNTMAHSLATSDSFNQSITNSLSKVDGVNTSDIKQHQQQVQHTEQDMNSFQKTWQYVKNHQANVSRDAIMILADKMYQDNLKIGMPQIEAQEKLNADLIEAVNKGKIDRLLEKYDVLDDVQNNVKDNVGEVNVDNTQAKTDFENTNNDVNRKINSGNIPTGRNEDEIKNSYHQGGSHKNIISEKVEHNIADMRHLEEDPKNRIRKDFLEEAPITSNVAGFGIAMVEAPKTLLPGMQNYQNQWNTRTQDIRAGIDGNNPASSPSQWANGGTNPITGTALNSGNNSSGELHRIQSKMQELQRNLKNINTNSTSSGGRHSDELN